LFATFNGHESLLRFDPTIVCWAFPVLTTVERRGWSRVGGLAATMQPSRPLWITLCLEGAVIIYYAKIILYSDVFMGW